MAGLNRAGLFGVLLDHASFNQAWLTISRIVLLIPAVGGVVSEVLLQQVAIAALVLQVPWLAGHSLNLSHGSLVLGVLQVKGVCFSP